MPTSVTPYLTCTPATEAIQFYQKAFGASVAMSMPTPDGQIMHATLMIEEAMIYVSDNLGGEEIAAGSGGVTLHLQVDDCDAVFEKAIDAGCIVLMPLEDQFWGDRYGQLQDPYGHSWAVATTKSTPTPEEMAQAMQAMAQQ